MKNLLKNKFVLGGIILMIGLFLGWVIKPSMKQSIYSSNSVTATDANQPINKSANKQIYTCSMHPQIREDHPGKCPICGMDLIPLNVEEKDEKANADEIQMTDAAMKLAQVEITKVEKKVPVKDIYMPGKIQADERKIAVITSRFAGRIEKLFIDFTGQEVRKGQRLAEIYSPELVTAQKELFEAKKYETTNPSFYQAAVNKLKLWDLTDAQIQGILNKGEPQFYFDILAPQGGTVTKRIVTLGDYVKEGSELFEIADLNRVWVMFDAYEIDLPWIRPGDKIHFIVGSMPGQEYTSTVAFIDPVINPQSRTATVRAEIMNTKGWLKPEMFVTGIIHAVLPGKNEALVVPRTSILWTGKRAVVYVLKPGSDYIFSYRDIVLGPQAGDYYVVAKGLKEGEEVATNGVFKIDAAAQLQGKFSMMNPGGEAGEAGMPGMQMNGQKNNVIGDPEIKLQEQSMKSGIDPDKKFKDQLTVVYDKYLDLKDALFASNLDEARQSSGAISKQLKAVDMTLLKGDAHLQWMNYLDKINSNLDKINKSGTLDGVRESFAVLSSSFVDAVKSFGLSGRTAYYQFCPMANHNQGAYWLSQYKEIRNPYFGSKMPTCGSIKEVIQ